MNQVEIENRLLHEIHNLSVEKLEKTLDFVLSLKNRVFQDVSPQNEDDHLIQKNREFVAVVHIFAIPVFRSEV
jgi:hypothetical protein